MAVIAPARDLVPVQGTILLHKSAAPAWAKAVDLARKAYGKTISITYPYGGHRTLAQQAVMWLNRKSYSAGVAFPGFSVHGSGRCVDVGNFYLLSVEQLDAAMEAAGFIRTIESEPWHYEFRGTPAEVPDDIPNLSHEEDEVLIKANQTSAHATAGYVYRLVEGSFMAITNLEGNTLVPNSGAHVEAYDANEIELFFKLYGLWEQEPVPAATWGGSKTPLKGLGRRTGKVIYPA